MLSTIILAIYSKRSRPMNVGLLLMLLLEGIPPPAGMGGQARHLIQQAYQAELDVIAEVAAPKDREILAKQRSSHWAKMLFSSRIYFDGSMSNLFRMDSSTSPWSLSSIAFFER